MNRLQLYRLLRKNANLGMKRHPAIDQNTVAKVMMYIGAAMMAAYMIFIGSVLGKLAADDDEPALLLLILPFLLMLDFLLRFMGQQTPMLFVKPYLMMPLKRNVIIECYLVEMLFSGYNMLWLCLFVPYAIIIFAAGTSLMACLAVVTAAMLMLLINSQWYLLVRTLIGRSLLWWALPSAVYAAFLLPLVFDWLPSDLFYNFTFYFYEAPKLWLLALLLLAVLAAFFFLNRALQFRFVYEEISREQKKPAALKSVTQFAFLEKFGLTGEFLKLELKSIMRNKAIRSRVTMSLSLMIMLCLLISFTDVYDQKLMLLFWCFYCFSIYGVTTLTKVMAPEGNYIDFLMTQHENILMLLRAKYLFHVAILVVPLVIMIPAVVQEKFTPLMMLACMTITSGPVYAILFQLAVYNKQTLPLNQKIMGKNNMESGVQLVIELTAMFLPVATMPVLMFFLGDELAYTIVIVIGLAVTAAHPYWLRSVYRRMMKRKYVNMEGFHASR